MILHEDEQSFKQLLEIVAEYYRLDAKMGNRCNPLSMKIGNKVYEVLQKTKIASAK